MQWWRMKGESLADRKKQLRDQKQLDTCAEGFDVGRLSKLMGSEAAYTGELEDLYDKMLAKIDGLSKLVEQSNAKVLEQEAKSDSLRRKNVYRIGGISDPDKNEQ
ncbi:UNVERIFIED_CONTAM: hypothetical protein Sradi_5944900 [Sesamum radiatum]|uniref:Uncharacterized protein n=1 Tax=Sesamum radiatum TaxID=300843 RepID=A0AAW2KUW0_SESRA